VVTPWKRRWEMGAGAGLADDDRFIRACIAAGMDVHYVSPRDASPPDVSVSGYHVHAFPNFYTATATWPTPVRRVLWPMLFAVLAGWRAHRVERRVRPVVVLGQTYVAAFVTYLVASLARVPSVVKLFGVEDLVRTDWPAWKYLYRNAESIAAFKLPVDAWIILNDGTRGDQAARRHGVHAERIHFLPNGVELSWSERVGHTTWLRQQLNIANDVPVVLYLARLEAWKRPEMFIRAASRVIQGGTSRAVFVIGGDGPERARLQDIVRELGLSESVRFAGPIPHERVPDAMAAASLFVATAERSNQSIAVCEALLCGVPVVAFDVGETRSVVRNGETGKLVEDGNVAQLGDVVATLLGSETERVALATGARQFASTHLTDWSIRMETELSVLRASQRRR